MRKQYVTLALAAPQGIPEAPDAVAVVSSWVQILPLGIPPMNDTRVLEVTLEDAARVLANASGRKSRIPVLFEHGKGPRGGEAAGWLVGFERRPNGVYALVEWTELAAGEIRDRKWLYLSPGFIGAVAKRTGHIHPKALVEVSLTNTPAIDGMDEVSVMSQDFSDAFQDEEEDSGMVLTEFNVLLGLPETATEEEAKARIAVLCEAETKVATPAVVVEPEPEVTPEPKADLELAVVVETMSREDFDIKVEAEVAKRTGEAKHAIDVALVIEKGSTEGRIVPAAKEAFETIATQYLEEVKVILASIPEISPVTSALSGHPKEVDLEEAPDNEQAMTNAARYAKANGITIADARKALRKN